MRIGINCLRASPDYKGGVNSFTLGLLEGFAASRRPHDYVIFASRQNRKMFRPFETLANFSVVELDAPWVRPFRGLFNRIPWRLRFALPTRAINRLLNWRNEKRIEQAVDVQFVPSCPTPIYPFPATPSLYAIHDLQHVRFPNFFTARERKERDVSFDNCVRHARMIQATSKQMADEFLGHFPNLSPGQIVIIPEGVDVDAYAAGPAPEDTRRRLGLPDNFLFYPAQFWPHKDHLTILRALQRLRAKGLDIPIVLTGHPYQSSERIFEFVKANGLGRNVFYLGVVPYSDIVALHRAARFLVTASLYEAGSIPILEAAAAGTPIIASAIPSHVEHSLDLQMQLFAPGDDAALAEVLERVWNDQSLIETQTKFNSIAVRKFTWANAAERYLDSFEKLASCTNAPRSDGSP